APEPTPTPAPEPTPTPTPEPTPTPTPAAEAVTNPAVNESEPATLAAEPAATEISNTDNSTSTTPVSANNSVAENTAELKTYKVRKFDTLMKIAFKIYGDPFGWDDIFQLNKELIVDPNHIHKGMLLKYKPPLNGKTLVKRGHKYTIRPGDTLLAISQALYGTSRKWKSIWVKNNDVIHNPEKIMAGLVIYYSGGHKPIEKVNANSDTQIEANKEQSAAVAPPKSVLSKLFNLGSLEQTEPKGTPAPANSGWGAVGNAPTQQSAGVVEGRPAPVSPGDSMGPNPTDEIEPAPAH
ncbi:MAG: LysM peptidoglycan-binding domain-containing protein, partial [Bdellovibrionia bacterium]